MSRGQTLRALVNERLAAVAEEIFVLFERTIAEYEEELCRSKAENQRKQQVLDKVLRPRIELVRENFQIPSTSPGPGLNQEITETPWIKEESEEHSVELKEEQLPVPVPESSDVCMNTEESSLHQDETQGEDISSEPYFHLETGGHIEHLSETDNDVHWEPFNYEAARSTGLFPNTAPETTVHSGHMSGADGGAQEKKHECPFCHKRFGKKHVLQRHYRVHTGERPFSCKTCKNTFIHKHHLDSHMRLHTGERPFNCRVCEKAFAQKCALDAHMRTHTGEKPFICPVCNKGLASKPSFKSHMKLHNKTE